MATSDTLPDDLAARSGSCHVTNPLTCVTLQLAVLSALQVALTVPLVDRSLETSLGVVREHHHGVQRPEEIDVPLDVVGRHQALDHRPPRLEPPNTMRLIR